MRPKDPILAFAFHCAVAFIACTVGSILGAAWNGGGTFSLWRQALPVILAGATAGHVAGAWSQSRAAIWIWVPPGLLLGWLLISESTGWTDRTRPEGVPLYVWNQFIGPRCGETECTDAILGTAPFLGAVAYSLAAKIARQRGGNTVG